MNEEEINPNFNLEACITDAINKAYRIIDKRKQESSTSGDCSDEVSLAYDFQEVKKLLDLYKIEKEKNKEHEAKKQIAENTVYSMQNDLMFKNGEEYFVPVSKIKARIEELEKSCNICHFRGSICKDFKAFNQCTFQVTIKNLQSLLEEE